MFGRKNEMSPEPTASSNTSQETQSQASQSPASSASPASARVTPTVSSPTPSSRRNDPMGRRSERSNEERRLTVGRGLSLSGEIAACDVLVVEGKVEAKLSDGKLLEITESGQFRGAVEIENADIAGRYDGQLTVHGRLTIRSTGRISGIIRYGELEINAGGQVIGEMQVVGADVTAATTTAATGSKGFKNAAKFAALSEEETSEEANKYKGRRQNLRPFILPSLPTILR